MTEHDAVQTPTTTDAETWRRSMFWFFTPGPGLTIKCRHLDLAALLVTGALPLPVLDAVKKHWGTELTTRQAVEDAERRAELLVISRHYACAAAVEPRVVMTADPNDATALACEDIGDALLIELFNEGMTRRLEAAPAIAGTFRSAPAAPGRPAGSAGPSVQPPAELLVRPLADGPGRA